MKSVSLKIEKLIYGGDGLARMPVHEGSSPDLETRKGKSVFVPFVLEGEEVLARIVEEKSSFGRARVEQVRKPSPQRIEPGCPYFQNCGGCHYQHTSYEHQLEIKKSILYETLKRTAKLDWQEPIEVHASPPWNYRNRTRMKVRVDSGGFALGYYRFGSHQLLAIEKCPISSPLINRAITAIWDLGKKGLVPSAIAEIEFFANAEDTELLLELYVDSTSAEVDESGLTAFAEKLKKPLPEFIGAAAFASTDTASAKSIWSFGTTELIYRTKTDWYRVRAGSFFQTNRFLTDELISIVCSNRSGELALDLYAGTGLFSLALAHNFKRVISVESGSSSFADLRSNAPANIESVRSTTEEYFRKPQPGNSDYIVVDPPRAGLGEKIARSLAKLAPPRICYVSCDPSTLARDLRALIESGYRIESIHLVDLFPQTFHLETIVQLVR